MLVDPTVRQYCIDILFVLFIMLIDGGRGRRDHISLTTWVSQVEEVKDLIIKWEAYRDGLANQMFTPAYLPYQQALTHIQALKEYLRELEGDD